MRRADRVVNEVPDLQKLFYRLARRYSPYLGVEGVTVHLEISEAKAAAAEVHRKGKALHSHKVNSHRK